MLWELIATFSAGLGAAGIALLLRKLFKKLPKTLIPAAGGLGMLAFQIYSEYHWFAQTRARLPQSAVVIAEQRQSAWYKPWSHVYPPVVHFVVADRANHEPLADNPMQRHTLLYFFERRAPVQHWPLLIDCATRQQANLPQTPESPVQWQRGEYSAAIAEALCR
ncbi:MAG: hypothetical protein Q4D61_05910 [Cardiobacteriaceae bacterium]|nr:hypothetical protein [Cardiobacteriaceae bacterium]